MDDQRGPLHSHAGPSAFPYATHASIIRSVEKDQGYAADLYEKLFGVLRRMFGPQRALLYRSEIKLLADLVYYTQTITGEIGTTLGEEYCSILRKKRRRRGERRVVDVLLAVLQGVQPYLEEKRQELQARYERDEMHGDSLVRGSFDGRVDAQLMQLYEATTGAGTEVTPGSSRGGARGGRPASDQRDQGDETTESRSHMYSKLLRKLASMIPEPVVHAKDRLQCAWRDGIESCSPYFRWFILHSGSFSRLHLALFYMFGIYYDVPKRILGVRYVGYGPAAYAGGADGRQGALGRLYRVLGVLLMAQALAPIIRSLYIELYKRRMDGNDEITDDAKGAHAANTQHCLQQTGRHGQQEGLLFLDYMGNPVDWNATSNSNRDTLQNPTRRKHKCPLCLSDRQTPTATPCGHVFCWTCIVEWCETKPECPLCRSLSECSQLAPIRHGDF